MDARTYQKQEREDRKDSFQAEMDSKRVTRTISNCHTPG